MRILALVTDAFGGFGGIAQYNRDLLTALTKADGITEVIVLPRNGIAVPETLSTGLKQLSPQSEKFQYMVQALACLLSKGRFDVIFCGHLYMMPLAALLGRLFHVPVWLQLHGIEAWECKSPLRRWAAEQATLVTAVSRYTRGRFLRWANLEPERVRVLPNTVSQRFHPGDREQLRRTIGIEDRQVLLTVGRLAASEAYKGHDRVLHCLPELQHRYPRLLYLIAGTGDDQLRLEGLATQLKVTQCTRFLGQVPNDQLIELYQAADLFIMPSTGEGFGIVFLEAMACGTPALGLDQDGSRDPLRDGKLGYISDPQNLCRTISRALDTERPCDLTLQVCRWFGYEDFEKHVTQLIREDLVLSAVAGD